MREVERAVREAANSTGGRCYGAILDVLLERFPLPPPPRPSAVPGVLQGMVTEWEGLVEPRPAPVVEGGAWVGLAGSAYRNGEFWPYWRDVRPSEQGFPPVVGFAAVQGLWRGHDSLLVALVDLQLQSDHRNDPTVRARPFRQTDAILDFKQAYITGRLGRFVLSFGRGNDAWLGEGRESLLFGAHGPAMDRLSASARWSRFEARAIAVDLDEVVLTAEGGELEPGTPPQRFSRILVGHALVWRPGRSLELTAGEMGLIARGWRTLEFAYLNPLMAYLITENDQSGLGDTDRDNRAAFGAVRVSGGPASLTGELVVDDFQIDAPDREVYPHQLAWRLAATLALPALPGASATAEYRRVGSYTYMRGSYAVAWQYYDQPLGSELGPAADMTSLRGEIWPTGRLRLEGGIGQWRRGGLRIDQRPGESAAGHANERFPSVTEERPLVQTSLMGHLDARWMSRRMPITLRVEGARIENVNNRPSAPALYLRTRIMASYAFRNL